MASLKKTRSANLARTLPVELQEKLATKARDATSLTREIANRIDDKHAITETYGVTIDQFHRYLRRLRQHSQQHRQIETEEKGGDEKRDQRRVRCADQTPTTKQEDQSETKGSNHDTSSHDDDRKTQARRERQAGIATVLQQLFGHHADLAPDLWSHRAFLMMMGLAYEKLSTNENELSTDEIVKLTKALGDACKVNPRTTRKADEHEEENNRKRSIPKQFSEIVRQVYGTNFNETK